MTKQEIRIRDLFLITLGCALYALGLVSININNHLAEGGITGITLILRFWFQIDPAYSSLLLNIPLIIVGYKFLGRNALLLTIYGTVMLS
ncbi:YitT family protein, partial [Loigolactobacillus coryniformis]